MNHTFELLRKSDKLQRRGGVPLDSCHRKILEKKADFSVFREEKGPK